MLYGTFKKLFHKSSFLFDYICWPKFKLLKIKYQSTHLHFLSWVLCDVMVAWRSKVSISDWNLNLLWTGGWMDGRMCRWWRGWEAKLGKWRWNMIFPTNAATNLGLLSILHSFIHSLDPDRETGIKQSVLYFRQIWIWSAQTGDA